METKGAVDLQLSATRVRLPDGTKTRQQRDQIERWAQQSWVQIPPVDWERLQVTRLATASVLLARLLHVRTERLGRFLLTADPDSVTVAQLAALHRPHSGTAGQAFELAVSAAVSSGVPEVADLIREALQQLNMTGEGPVAMVALGLEKVPAEHAEVFWNEVRELLPADGRLRTGRPGRPPSIETALTRLATSTWHTMSVTSPDPPSRPRHIDGDRLGYRTDAAEPFDLTRSIPDPVVQRQVRWGSQLGRADALIVCGSDLVATSLKINERHTRDAWRDVPLWITVGPVGRVRTAAWRGLPNVTVTLPIHGWYAYFRDALLALDKALDAVDTGLRPPAPSSTLDERIGWNVSDVIAQQLWRMRNEPISTVVEELRRIHPGLADQLGDQFGIKRATLDVTSLNIPPVVDGWRRESETAMLFTTQRHLFRTSTDWPPPTA